MRRTVLLKLLLLVLSSLGGAGCRRSSSSDEGPPSLTIVYELDGLSFGPFSAGEDPLQGDSISEAELRRRLGWVAPYARRLRTFGVSNGLEHAGRIAHELGREVAVGAWLGPSESANAAEIASLIEIAQEGHADLVIAGSEVLLRGDLTEAQLIAHIEQLRAQVPSGIPVATADVYSVFLSHPALVEAVDLLLVNYYPYWEGVAVEDAVRVMSCWHLRMIRAANGKPVQVSETGWPSAGNAVGDAVPSPENAAFYLKSFVSWARAQDIDYFYFEALDEPYKALQEGPQGAHWGICDTSGRLKPGMGAVLEGEIIAGDWSYEPLPGGPGAAAIELTFLPPYGSFEDLQGRILHADPLDNAIAVYIYVAGGWWTKPSWSDPLTIPWCDGSFVCDITTGGIDQFATWVAAFLLPAGDDPPLVSGGAVLPDELYQQAIAWVVEPRSP